MFYYLVKQNTAG